MLGELIALELELRRDALEHPDRREYLDRFPDDPAAVDHAFDDLDTVAGPEDTVATDAGSTNMTLLLPSTQYAGGRPGIDRRPRRAEGPGAAARWVALLSFGDFELLGEIAPGRHGGRLPGPADEPEPRSSPSR